MPGAPQTIEELFTFYHEYVKILYSSIQADGKLPDETLFELNAALDHISRYWVYKEAEADVVHKAYSHFKRSCLDIFKLKVKDNAIHFSELRELDTSFLDNGDFDGRLIAARHKIKKTSIEARRLEGKIIHDDDFGEKAFALWLPVFDDCVKFEEDFYLHPKIDWARKKVAMMKRKDFWIGIVVSFVVGFVTSLAYDHREWAYDQGMHLAKYCLSLFHSNHN